MLIRKAHAQWNGTLKEGHGKFEVGNSRWSAPYSFQTRFGEGEQGTNPEELIAAAHASCYAMALAATLEQAGFIATAVDATANVRLDTVPGGFAITEITLDVNAKVPGLDAAQFATIAEQVKTNCPVSKALASVKITLNARLEA
ncbi:MAG: OsmC family protein [Legionellales bacterium]|jgi:osmotically inducible protein OsmC